MTRERFDVLFDGGCGLCTRTVAWLRRLDRHHVLRFVDISAEWDGLEASYPGLRRDACVDEMHVVAPDGRITAGFDAFRTIALALTTLAPVAPLLHVPGVPFVGRRVYRYVATHRSTTCRVPDSTSNQKGSIGAR